MKNSKDHLPVQVENVIIGSGIPGALIAHELQQNRSEGLAPPSMIMLEARSVCSGASGRNGGHIKPDCYKNFARFQKQYGTEEAVKLCRIEVENARASVEFIRQQGLADACDLVEARACDIFMNADAWANAKASIAAYREAVGILEGITVIEKEQFGQHELRFEGAHGAVSYPACSLWPYTLVTELIHRAVENGLELFTNTSVLRVEPMTNTSDTKTARWRIKTNKGDVLCKNVFHATNGYISHLLPEFAGKVVPLKGNVVALGPPPAYASHPMGHTTGIQWGPDFDYMIQRPTDGKPLIYGGRDLAHHEGFTAGVGDCDDSTTTPEIIDSLQEVPSIHMTDWDRAKASLRFAWSGIMGLTADELPFVGEVPGKPGQFTASGYSGHGMARAFLTVKALMQLYHGERVDDRIPNEYFKIAERLAKRDSPWEEILERNLALPALKHSSKF